MNALPKKTESKFLDFSSSFSEKFIMTVKMYVDESGTDNNTDTVVVAGYLSTADAWGLFCDDWKQVLKEYKVTHFHCSEFNSQHSFYKSWDRWAKENFITELTKVIRNHTKFGFAVAIDKKLYARIFPPEIKDAFVNEYTFCLWMFLDSFQKELNTRADLAFAKDEPIAFFFEQQPTNFKCRTDVVYNLRLQFANHKKTFGAHAFLPKEGDLNSPLQACDLLACRFRKAAARALKDGDKFSVKGWDVDLGIGNKDMLAGYHHDADALKRIAVTLCEYGKKARVSE